MKIDDLRKQRRLKSHRIPEIRRTQGIQETYGIQRTQGTQGIQRIQRIQGIQRTQSTQGERLFTLPFLRFILSPGIIYSLGIY